MEALNRRSALATFFAAPFAAKVTVPAIPTPRIAETESKRLLREEWDAGDHGWDRPSLRTGGVRPSDENGDYPHDPDASFQQRPASVRRAEWEQMIEVRTGRSIERRRAIAEAARWPEGSRNTPTTA